MAGLSEVTTSSTEEVDISHIHLLFTAVRLEFVTLLAQPSVVAHIVSAIATPSYCVINLLQGVATLLTSAARSRSDLLPLRICDRWYCIYLAQFIKYLLIERSLAFTAVSYVMRLCLCKLVQES